MDALIGNLKTYEINRIQYISNEWDKKDKSLLLKISPGEAFSEEDDTAYLTKGFH